MNDNEAEFRTKGHGKTQLDRLEMYFRAHPNEWLELPDLALQLSDTGIGVRVPSRVHELRQSGMNIEHVNNFATEDGVSKCFSRYRFVPENFDLPAPVLADSRMVQATSLDCTPSEVQESTNRPALAERKPATSGTLAAGKSFLQAMLL